MKQMREKNRIWLAYTLYAVLLTLGLLYFLFPSQDVKDYLEVKAGNSTLPVHLSIGDVLPSLALGLSLRDTEFSRQTSPDKTLFRTDRLVVRPSVWSFLRGDRRFYFDGLTYNGTLKGFVQFDEDDSENPFSASMTLKDIRMDEFEDLSNLIGRHVEGRLGGNIAYNGDPKSLTEGAGEADLRLSNGLIELQQPVLDFDTIDFNEVWIKMVFKNRKIDLSHVELRGPNIYGTLSGTVSIRQKFTDSGLNLKGTVDPSEGFFQGSEGASVTIKLLEQSFGDGPISFAIRGTLKKPKFIPL